MVLNGSVKITNSDNIDQTFLQEPSSLDYLFAISSQPLKSTPDRVQETAIFQSI